MNNLYFQPWPTVTCQLDPGPKETCNWVQWAEFLHDAVKMQDAASFSDRVDVLKNYCKTSQPGIYKLWVTLPDGAGDILLKLQEVEGALHLTVFGSEQNSPAILEIHASEDSVEGTQTDALYWNLVNILNLQQSKWLGWQELQSEIENRAREGRHLDRIAAMKEVFTQTGLQKYEVWVDVPERWNKEDGHSLRIVLEEGGYDRSSLVEEFFFESDLANQHAYHYLMVYEDEGPERPLLKIRTSWNGEKNEICWIQAGLHISGNEAMDMYKDMEALLAIQQVYLFDDMKFSLPGRSSSPLVARHYVPIAREDEKTLYAYKLDFVPESCSGVWHADREVSFTQSPQQYKQAVKLLRDLKLGVMQKTICKHRPKKMAKIYKIARQVFSRKNVADLCLGAVCGRLYGALMEKNVTPQDRDGHHKRLYNFSREALSIYQGVPENEDEKSYMEALTEIDSTRIWVRRRPTV